MTTGFVDIHCHLLPGIDDGAQDWDVSLAMARMAWDDGTVTIIATPHQLGSFRQNGGDAIRAQVAETQRRLNEARVPLTVLPGADVRIEEDLLAGLASGDVLTLGDQGRHVLLELPHELYLPMESMLGRLARQNIAGILSHPERNVGILRQPELLLPLVDAGCLLQVTAGSFCGAFGPACQHLAEWILAEGLAHFVATDAHGLHSRRPLMQRAYERIAELVDAGTADDLCCSNPRLVAEGKPVPAGRRHVPPRQRNWWRRKTAA